MKYMINKTKTQIEKKLIDNIKASLSCMKLNKLKLIQLSFIAQIIAIQGLYQIESNKNEGMKFV
jgi:hypothetical protein